MDNRGYILLESTIVYVILAFALVSLMPVFVLTVRAGTASADAATSTQLSTELLEEIRLRKWDESTPAGGGGAQSPGVLGVDAGESSFDKRTFNDVDDFDRWTESPPQDPLGKPLEGFASYTRTVSVRYVDADLKPSQDTDLKQVTVCTAAPRMKPICLDALFANR